MSCFHLRTLTIDFSTAEGTLRAVDRVDLDHHQGETLALVGETGCGKSVIALAILGLLPENSTVSGEVLFHGRDLLALSERELQKLRGEEIAIVLQNPTLALDPIMRIGRQIGEALVIHRGIKMKATRTIVESALDRLGFKRVGHHLASYPFELSGGMNQRVVTAASLILGPGLLIADEPTTGLDPESAALVVEELQAVKQNSETSLLLITHDLDLAESIADRIAVMYGGQIIEEGPNSDFFASPGHPYSQALIKSRPVNGFNPIPGPPIDMTAPPRGCRFSPRCQLFSSECAFREPLQITKNGRTVRCLKY